MFAGKTDVAMSLDGDIMVKDGDLRICDGFEWVYREVNKRIRTTNPSWKTYPTIGASLRDFYGKPNNEATAREIRQRIKSCLDQDNISYPGEFAVRVIPTGKDSISIYIYLILPGTKVELYKFIYSYIDDIVQHMEDTGIYSDSINVGAKRVDVNTKQPPVNKYVRAINGA